MSDAALLWDGVWLWFPRTRSRRTGRRDDRIRVLSYLGDYQIDADPEELLAAPDRLMARMPEGSGGVPSVHEAGVADRRRGSSQGAVGVFRGRAFVPPPRPRGFPDRPGSRGCRWALRARVAAS
jgi:hypothetical protein